MSQGLRRYVLRWPADGEDKDAVVSLLEALKVESEILEGREDGEYFSITADPALLSELARNREGQALIYEVFFGPGDSRNEHRISIDPPLSASDEADRRNRSALPLASFRVAESLIGADAVRAYAAGGARTVNVVIADGALEVDYLRRYRPAGAAQIVTLNAAPGVLRPRMAPNRWHANMTARVVLALAPQARLFSLPILPDRIDDIDRFASDVLPGFEEVGMMIGQSKFGGADAAWVLVCPWGLVSREYETGLVNYSDERGHVLSKAIRALVAKNVDVVFSAGNNGLFAPDWRAGVYDRGPGDSIFGANGLPEVLTVGAVTTTGDWIGASSQGPEPDGLRTPGEAVPRKPDVCAPSWFRFEDDAHAVVTGTSGSCAVAAGVIAALRRRVGPAQLAPAKMIDAIRATAAPVGHRGGGDRRLPASLRQGHGVIDGARLGERLSETTVPPDGCLFAPLSWISNFVNR